MGLFGKKKKNVDIDYFPPIGGLMVSKMITEGNKKPMFMYRDKRSRPEDSGWRIFSGLESDEYTDNPENAGIYNPSTLLDIDPSIADILLTGGFGSAFERESEKSSWYRVTDFKVEDDYMVKHRLTEKWELNINNLFERQKEQNGDLLYTTGDKSLRIAVWNDDRTKTEIYSEHQKIITTRDESRGKTLKTYDFSDHQVARVGYMIKESDENRTYYVMYAFSIIDHQLIQAAFYFDHEDDESWAVETWKGIQLIE